MEAFLEAISKADVILGPILALSITANFWLVSWILKNMLGVLRGVDEGLSSAIQSRVDIAGFFTEFRAYMQAKER